MMNKGAGSALLVGMSLGLLLQFPATAQEQGPFKGLIGAAEAVVAVEIVWTDYSATPADGPMLAAAQVLRAIKGSFTKGEQFRFAETTWLGPTYQKGEYRLLFLERAKPSQGGEWRILSRLYAHQDFFVDKEVIPDLSLDFLTSFFATLEESGGRRRKIVISKDKGK